MKEMAPVQLVQNKVNVKLMKRDGPCPAGTEQGKCTTDKRGGPCQAGTRQGYMYN